METLNSLKDRALSIATAQTWMISIAIAVIVMMIVVGVWYAAPAISKMTSKRRDYSIDEEELDRLIDSIHERQMPSGRRRKVS